MSEKIRTTFYLSKDTKEKLRKYAFLVDEKYTDIIENILNKELTRLISEYENKEEN